MAVTQQPQTTLGEQLIDDTSLEAALEQRETLKAAAGAARKAYAEADEVAKTRIRELELGSAPARCGRFVIAERAVEGRSVAFDTNPSRRITIKADKSEDVF